MNGTPPAGTAAPASLRDLVAHPLVFVGGKGGVGKTTVAAALGLEAAERGRNCLIVSTDPAHSLGDIFHADIGASETRLSDHLWGLEIDPDVHAERHLEAVKDHMKALVPPRMYDLIDRQIDLARHAPGAREAALLERVAELMGEAGSRFDSVLFDTAPSGHTIHLLTLPETMEAWTAGLLRHRERSSRLASAIGRLGGGVVEGSSVPTDEAPNMTDDHVSARLRDALKARQRKFLAARNRLLDPAATAFLLVLNPDKLSILESRRVMDQLRRFKIEVTTLIINRVLPADLGTAAGNEFLDARRQQEQAYRREIETVFAPLPSVAVPLLRRDVHGIDAVRAIARVITDRWPRT